MSLVEAIVRALRELNDREALDEVFDTLSGVATRHDEDLGFRAQAAAALFRLGDPQGSKIVGEIADDILGRGVLEMDTTEILGELGDPRAVNPLVNLLKEKCERRKPIGDRSIRGEINDGKSRSHTREAIVRALVRLADAESCVFLLSEKWKEIISYANAPHTDRPHDDEAPHTTDCGAYTDSHEDLGAGFALPPTPSALSHEKVDLDF